VLEVLDAMEIDFDAEGHPEITLVAHPDTVRQLRELPAMTVAQERAFDELMARKRDEFRRRQRQRQRA
jgi:uncharacterized protein YfaQ (DUF2300 family)